MRASLGHLIALIAVMLAGPCLAANVIVTATFSDTFSPQHITINAGDTVTFKNAGGHHNVVADDGSFRCAVDCDAGGHPSSSSWSFTRQFNTPGTIGYYCEVHGQPGQGMFGTITVEGMAPPGFGTGGYLSGDWFDPAQSGHGFVLEFTQTNNTLVAFWFVHALDGSGPFWIVGVGPYDPTSNTVTVPAFLKSGTAFPPNFNPDDVVTTNWGTLTFTFTDCTNATATWSSVLPGYGSGSLPLVRLTQIAGTECPGQ